MDSSAERAGGKLVHLEKLYLIAQFYARDADEAARLVDQVYADINKRPSSGPVSLSVLVERLVALTRVDQTARSGFTGIQTDAQSARAIEADRFLDEHCRVRFLALSPDEKLELWHAVETGSDVGMLVSSDALGSFVKSIERLLPADARAVFGAFVNRSSVSGALRRYWGSDFTPVPPTLRSVVESRERPFESKPSVGVSHDTREPKKPARRSSLKRLVLYAWIVLAASGLGYLLTRVGAPAPPSSDIVQLSLSASSDLDLTFRTDNAEQAERFIQDRFGWRLSLPEIEDTSLEGVSLVSILDSVDLPVIVFTDLRDNSRIPVFSYSYTFLQSNNERFTLSSETLRQIQESDRFDVHAFRQKTAVIWRDQDDIFTAFVEPADQNFQSRVAVRS